MINYYHSFTMQACGTKQHAHWFMDDLLIICHGKSAILKPGTWLKYQHGQLHTLHQAVLSCTLTENQHK